MSETSLPFGEFLPDRPDLGNSTLIAKNVIPTSDGYRQVKSFLNTITALSERAQGSLSIKGTAGQAYSFCGTASKLYELTVAGTSWTDRSKSGGYSCASDEVWKFAQWGTQIVAAQIADAIQVATPGNTFANLASAAPKCRVMAVVKDFLVVGNTNDSTDGYRPNRLWWPAIGDITNWPTPGSASAIQVQSDYDDLEDGGEIAGIVGGEYGTVVTDRSIWIMNYVGASNNVFDIRAKETNRGTRYRGSVIGDGPNVFYLGSDGFYMFNGEASVPIGSQKVDKWFLDQLDSVYSPRICAAIDPLNKLVMWAAPVTGHTSGNPNRILIYNWAIGKWAYIDQTLEWLSSGAMSLGYSLDGLDAISSSLDALPFSLDSYVWQGGELILAGFDTSHRYGYFNSTAMAATLTTGEVQLSPGERSLVTAVTPLVANVGTDVTVTPITRARQQVAVSTGTAVSVNSVGEVPLLSDSRYHRFQVDITGGFTHAQGVRATYSASGMY